MSTYHCPICQTPLPEDKRYPNYICTSCSSQATDANGRKLIFANIDISGGFKATYADTNENYNSHICYIQKIKCIADEARFGGIVIQKAE